MHLFTATSEQLGIIRSIALKTWPVAYKEILSTAQLEYMLDLFYSIASLEEQLQQGHRFRICNDSSVHVGFSSVSVKENSPTVLRLNKLYVLPDVQGRGAGKFLLDDVKNYAAGQGFESVELNVNRNNIARNFYEKEGFIISEEVDISIGQGYFMNDYTMTWKVSS